MPIHRNSEIIQFFSSEAEMVKWTTGILVEILQKQIDMYICVGSEMKRLLVDWECAIIQEIALLRIR